MSKTTITTRMHADRTLDRVLEDGLDEQMPASPPMRPMTEEEIRADADADPMCSR